MTSRESNWANASKPDPREVGEWVATIRELIIAHYHQTGSWLTVAQILQKLTGP